ncbi:MAG: segregation/condensation protein [Paenibacillaceae bacterium]|nr:segregation/condensation protein [Paenibacillaceae bacterium]
MKVLYKLDAFEGPLDLLLHLIDKAEVDIYDIPIKQITEQYMEFVQTMQELKLDIASEFLVMAATLLSIKSKLLLPKPPVVEEDAELFDEGEDPRDELVRRLIEYRKYKEMAGQLRDMEQERSLLYTKEADDLTPFVQQQVINPVKGLAAFDLVILFQKALRKMASRNVVAKIRRDEISVKDRIRELSDLLSRSEGQILFSSLFDEELTREEIVVTFLALLELMKMKRIVCYQHGLFADIVIQTKEGGGIGEHETAEIRY